VPQWLVDLFSQYGYTVVFVGVLLENAGVPVPGETTLLVGAALAFLVERARPLASAMLVFALAGVCATGAGAPGGPTRFGAVVLTGVTCVIALAAVALLEIWNWTPFSFIILLAGLSAIPKEPIEAAEILGASKWRIFWEVQLPLLRPVIFLALVLRFLEAMAEFPKTWALFQGGPGSATETLPVYIFMTTWQYFQISKGAAMSYIVMVLMVVIVLIAIQLLRREKRSRQTSGRLRPVAIPSFAESVWISIAIRFAARTTQRSRYPNCAPPAMLVAKLPGST